LIVDEISTWDIQKTNNARNVRNGLGRPLNLPAQQRLNFFYRNAGTGEFNLLLPLIQQCNTARILLFGSVPPAVREQNHTYHNISLTSTSARNTNPNVYMSLIGTRFICLASLIS
jgi:hypothetical protein